MIRAAATILMTLAWLTPVAATAQTVTGLVISEVCYDVAGDDNGLEWVELFNGYSEPVELCEYRLGWGGTDYTYGQIQLEGTVAPGAYFVVGGPQSDALNGYPVFDLVLLFDPNIQNSGTTADAVGLFHRGCYPIEPYDVPVDAVIYGEDNANMLVDEYGDPGMPDVGDAPSGSTIERLGVDSWQIQSAPNPGVGPLAQGGGSLPTAVNCGPLPTVPQEINAIPFDSLEVDHRLDFMEFGFLDDPVFVDTVMVWAGLEIGERLAGQTLTMVDPDEIEWGWTPEAPDFEPTAPVAALPGDPGYNLSLFTRPNVPGEANILWGATPSGSPVGAGGSVALVFDEDQSEVGLELFLYGSGDLLATFWERDGTALGRLAVTLPSTPIDTPYALAFRHEDRLQKIAAVTAEWITAIGEAGYGFEAITFAAPGPVAVQPEDRDLPGGPRLLGNYPNPFNPATSIRFFLPERLHVDLAVHALDGRRVATLLNATVAAGMHDCRWDACDDRGRVLPSGTYFYRLEAGGRVQTKRMTLLK